MSEELVLWHDFNVSLVTASAGLLGLLFVALSIHVRVLSARQNAELRAVARTIFLGYVLSLAIGFLALMPQTLSAFGLEVLVLVLLATLPFAAAARSGLRATGVGYDRRVTVVQFIAGFFSAGTQYTCNNGYAGCRFNFEYTAQRQHTQKLKNHHWVDRGLDGVHEIFIGDIATS